MMSAPERIWAYGANHGSGNTAGTWMIADLHGTGTPYLRADIAASQLAKKQEQLDELPSPALWDESRKALASMRNEVGELRQQLAEARAEVERLTPPAVAYDYLESPAGREMAEAECDRLAADNAQLRADNAGLRKIIANADLWTDEEHDVAEWRTEARAALAGKE